MGMSVRKSRRHWRVAHDNDATEIPLGPAAGDPQGTTVTPARQMYFESDVTIHQLLHETLEPAMQRPLG